jgi:hypothetical protein
LHKFKIGDRIKLRRTIGYFYSDISIEKIYEIINISYYGVYVVNDMNKLDQIIATDVEKVFLLSNKIRVLKKLLT